MTLPVRAGALLCAVAALVAACDGGGVPHVNPTPTVSASPYSAKPNIVFVLTDDLSSDLVKFMPHVIALQQAGTTFSNYTVTDSYCCPSRASIFSGRFPHNTRVFTNDAPTGGFSVFHSRGEEKQTFATALHGVGYRTAMLGKYLNGYLPRGGGVAKAAPNYVPPGWDTWAVTGNGYPEYGYKLNQNHRIVSYGHSTRDYLTTVLGGFGTDFINSSVADRKPFLLELATFAPHAPYIPEPSDQSSFLGLQVPRGAAFNRVPTQAPRWLARLHPLVKGQLALMDADYVKRVEDVQSVDRTIGSLEATLRRTGQLSNTVFVFSSDNGFHMGEHGLAEGKRTAFDTDIRVPLVVAGPGVKASQVNHEVVENIDLAPTFETLAGASVPSTVDGRSLVPLLGGASPEWRTAAAVEHSGRHPGPGDPDQQSNASGDPPTYRAIRTSQYLYVRYVDGEREYYDLRRDPDELHNLAGQLSPSVRATLDQKLGALVACHGGTACWTAGGPQRV